MRIQGVERLPTHDYPKVPLLGLGLAWACAHKLPFRPLGGGYEMLLLPHGKRNASGSISSTKPPNFEFRFVEISKS